jgi:hypothetical protein
VPRNDLKDAINDLMIEYYAKKNNKRCSIIIAEDTYKNSPLLGHIQFQIRQTYSSKKTQNLYSFLKIYKGLKVMLTENRYPTLGLVNGTIGIVHEIILDHDTPGNDVLFIKPPLHVLVDFNSFINDHKSSLNDIMIENLPKNIVPIVPISRSFDYIHEIEGPQYSKKFSIKKRQIPLSPAFCLIDYKGQGETFNNLIVDFSKPPDRNPLTMHNIYVTLSRLRSSEGLVLLRDITIEDLQKAKYRDGALEYMNPEQNNNSNGKQKIHTKDFQSKCTNTSKPRAMSPKLEIKPTSTKTFKWPKQPPSLITPIPKDNRYNNIIHEMHPTNPIIDLDTCLEPIDHDLNEFDWSKDLSLSRRDEEELLQPNAWLTDMHMNATFILLYRAKFQQINYEPHRYSFTETNAIYHK